MVFQSWKNGVKSSLNFETLKDKSGIIFHFFLRAFKQKKIKALRPKMTKIASRGSCGRTPPLCGYSPPLCGYFSHLWSQSLNFFLFESSGKKWKMTPLLCACAVVITLETQKCWKRAPRSVELNFFIYCDRHKRISQNERRRVDLPKVASHFF